MGGFEYVEATLDLTGCKDRYDLHDRLKTALQFPEHYGYNWSAFWDSLRFDSPVDYITIIGQGSLPADMHQDIEKMHEIFLRCKNELARYGEPFDVIVES